MGSFGSIPAGAGSNGPDQSI
jgi:5'-AMP-activated protein kinase catalytic alpha subunit